MGSTVFREQPARHMHAVAFRVAENLESRFRETCEIVAIAGSLRRQERWVKDIEIVAIPRMRADLFGEPLDGPSELDAQLQSMTSAKGILEYRQPLKNGDRYKALRHRASNLPLDLFIVRPPAQWGAILAIRTGPASFSKHLVTMCRDRGFVCEGGRLRRGVKTISTPTEAGFFEACGVPYVEPRERR